MCKNKIISILLRKLYGHNNFIIKNARSITISFPKSFQAILNYYQILSNIKMEPSTYPTEIKYHVSSKFNLWFLSESNSKVFRGPTTKSVLVWPIHKNIGGNFEICDKKYLVSRIHHKFFLSLNCEERMRKEKLTSGNIVGNNKIKDKKWGYKLEYNCVWVKLVIILAYYFMNIKGVGMYEKLFQNN